MESGRRIAHRYASTGTITYYAEDMLETARVILPSTAGGPCYDGDFYPFGGEREYTSTCAENYKFEGKKRDQETGNDDFGARYYSSSFGRWESPDWSSTPEPVPYANLTNPQTLNLYAMVSDNPESFADLDGHCPECFVEIEEALPEILAPIEAQSPALAKFDEAVGDQFSAVDSAITSASSKAGDWLVAAAAGALSLLKGDNKPSTATTDTKGSAAPNEKKSDEPQANPDGAGARKGGGRDERKANTDRVKSAKDNLTDLRKQRDAASSSPNKTPADKKAIDKLDRAINRELDRQRKSETHSRKAKGQN